MENKTVKIVVATHKKYKMPTDEMYLPLHVGAAGKVDACGNPLDLGYQKDNTGDNISGKNASFCELTGLYWAWKNACLISEQCYFSLLKSGATPQEARSVLPNSLKTEVVITANIREWRHFLKLRCSPAAHPQMREVALILLDKVHALIPVCFDDIWSEYHADV